MESQVNIVLVDDHKIFRIGLEVILNGIPNFKVIESYGDGKSLIEGLTTDRPDIIFMDIKLPDKDGITLTQFIKKRYPDVKIIALTMFGEIEYFNEMIDAGADGFLLKNTDLKELEEAVVKVVKGGTYFAKEFRGHLNYILKDNKSAGQDVQLSERELDVLGLICEGFSNNEIAEKLFISTHTVDGHRRNLISKTGVKNAPNLVMFAIKNGLIT
jgi:DNA-binding NarL/FixJ family response regulator